jgi:hypothetical protein
MSYFSKGKSLGKKSARAYRRGFNSGYSRSMASSKRSKYVSRVRNAMSSGIGRAFGAKATFVRNTPIKGVRVRGTVASRNARRRIG